MTAKRGANEISSLASDCKDEADRDKGAKARIRLLVPCVDGVVPYMTPHLLEQYFPVERVRDILILGLAVADTCVAPIYPDASQDDNRENAKKKKKKPKDNKRVCGYEFSDRTQPDPWIVPYPRLTVPTFDAALDDLKATNNRKQQPHRNEQMLLWTPNGRTPLHQEQHRRVCRGLGSHSQIPLYDDPSAANQKKDSFGDKQRNVVKHALASLSRTQAYTKDMMTHFEGHVWQPILCDIPEVVMKRQLEACRSKLEPANKATLAGIVLLGWQHISERKERMEVLTKACLQCPTKVPLAVLNATSLRQMMDLVSAISTENRPLVIGTKVCQQWSLSKKAFVFSLPPKGQSARKVKADQAGESSLSMDADGCVSLEPLASKARHAWFHDSRPLVKGCDCLTCKRYSRSYIHHLVCAKELLAEILLFGHNLHHMLKLVRDLNDEATEIEVALRDVEKSLGWST